MKVYVVQGNVGEYSDHTEWPVAAFLSESAAANLAVKLTNLAANLKREDFSSEEDEENTRVMTEAGDPHFKGYYSDRSSYTFFAVEIKDWPRALTEPGPVPADRQFEFAQKEHDALPTP